MNPPSPAPWKHALLGCLYGSILSALLLLGGHHRQGPTNPMVLALAVMIPLMFGGLAGLYREAFWERALFRNRETRKRMLGWLLGIILILILFRFMK